jgi:P4 family phage/plasmid primase-like protien
MRRRGEPDWKCPYFIAIEPEEKKITDKQITDTIMGNHLFYCDKYDVNTSLYVWDGEVWHNGVAEGIILNELSNLFEDEDHRHGMVLERTVNFIKGQAMNTHVEPKPPELIAFKNGILNVKTLDIVPHDPKLFYVHVIPWNWNPAAECPKWRKFLEDVTKSEQDRLFLQEWMGYSLYEAYPEPGFLVLTGAGQNGKTVFMTVFTAIVGERNIVATDLATLTYSEYGKSQLYRRLACISDDIGSTTIKNTGTLKEVSSGSLINAREIYGKPFDFRNYAKPTYACNEPPEIADTSEAIKFRLKVVEFPYTFVKEPKEGQKQARDRDELVAELMGEAEGIIRWAIDGLRRFIAQNFKFTTSQSTEETWQFYERKSKPVMAFVDEELEFTGNDADTLTFDQLYAAFQTWAVNKGLKLKLGRRKFAEGLLDSKIQPEQRRADDRKRLYYGIKCHSVKASNPSAPLKIDRYNIEGGEEVGKEGYTEKRDGVPPVEKLEPQADFIARIASLLPVPPHELVKHFTDEELPKLHAALEHLRQRGKLVLEPDEDGRLCWKRLEAG